MRNLLNNKEIKIEELRKSLQSKIKELEGKLLESEKSRELIQAENKIIKNKIAEKDNQICELKNKLMGREQNLLKINNQSLWARIRAVFKGFESDASTGNL